MYRMAVSKRDVSEDCTTVREWRERGRKQMLDAFRTSRCKYFEHQGATNQEKIELYAKYMQSAAGGDAGRPDFCK